MKRFALTILFTLALVTPAMAITREEYKEFIHQFPPAMVVRVIDGDTLVLTVFEGKEERRVIARLEGIDAPEVDQPGSDYAAMALEVAGRDESLYWEYRYTDRYGREVGALYGFEYGPIAANLLAQGAAWVYPKYCKEPWCDSARQIEQRARKEKRGIWADPNPVPPWKWRGASHKSAK